MAWHKTVSCFPHFPSSRIDFEAGNIHQVFASTSLFAFFFVLLFNFQLGYPSQVGDGLLCRFGSDPWLMNSAGFGSLKFHLEDSVGTEHQADPWNSSLSPLRQYICA